MFFSIRHGANETDLFNPDCSLRLLLDSIKRRCNFPLPKAGLGLIDEQYVIIYLSDQNPELTSCTSLFTDRGVYTLLAIIQREGGGPVRYKAIVDKEKLDPDLEQKLEQLSNPRAAEKSNWRKAKTKAHTVMSLTGTSKKKSSSSSLSKSFSFKK